MLFALSLEAGVLKCYLWKQSTVADHFVIAHYTATVLDKLHLLSLKSSNPGPLKCGMIVSMQYSVLSVNLFFKINTLK